MFGSNDQNQNSDAQTTAAAGPASGSSTAPSAPTLSDPMVTLPAQPGTDVNDAPMQSTYTEPAPQIGPIKPSEPENMPSAATPTISTGPAPVAIDPDLAQIRQQALQSLEPLVGQLDQTPDEKFKTIMMLIQTSDNSKLLKEAHEAAIQITDEKARAQALLDIVNEINYFTAQAQNN